MNQLAGQRHRLPAQAFSHALLTVLLGTLCPAAALAQDLLAHCLEARPWPEHLLADLVASGGDRELFRIVVERLADLFEPDLCGIYAELYRIQYETPAHASGAA